ncbi:hypothetical protein QZH41_004439 [Actinostola sp. cb2023]|nr:hypothetical protein QZH41_004439 [Actinostola sp. cb2023]
MNDEHTKRGDQELEDPFDKQAESASHLGQLQFIVEYDLHRHILAVRLVRAINLSLPSTYDEPAAKPCNPYAIVELLPDYRHQLQSNVQRKTSHPRFDETFEFDVEIKNLQQQFLWITVLSFETFSKHDVIGQVVVPLSDLNLSKKSVLLKGLEPSVKVNCFFHF